MHANVCTHTLFHAHMHTHTHTHIPSEKLVASAWHINYDTQAKNRRGVQLLKEVKSCIAPSPVLFGCIWFGNHTVINALGSSASKLPQEAIYIYYRPLLPQLRFALNIRHQMQCSTLSERIRHFTVLHWNSHDLTAFKYVTSHSFTLLHWNSQSHDLTAFKCVTSHSFTLLHWNCHDPVAF